MRARVTQLWQTRMLRYSQAHRGRRDRERAVATTTSPSCARSRACTREIEARAAGHEVAPFLRMGHWIGGDRDGNPNVSADDAAMALRGRAEMALRFYLTEVH